MKGVFIPDITVEMFRNGCLEGIETLMAEGELYNIEYPPTQPEVLAHGEGELTVPECEDAIGRQAAINAAIKESQVDGAYGYMDTKSIEDLPNDLPAVTPKPKWIPCSERMPENASHKGALCPRYLVMTKWGITQGWFNPDTGVKGMWHILVWLFAGINIPKDINFAKGDRPKMICVPKSYVTAWMEFPKPYQEVSE